MPEILDRFKDYVKLSDSEDSLETIDGREIHLNSLYTVSASETYYKNELGDSPTMVDNVKDAIDIITDKLWYVNPTVNVSAKSNDVQSPLNTLTYYSTSILFETGSIVNSSAGDLSLRITSNKNHDKVTNITIKSTTSGTTQSYTPPYIGSPLLLDINNVYSLDAFTKNISSSHTITCFLTDTKSNVANKSINFYFYYPLFYKLSDTTSYPDGADIYDDSTKLIINTNSTITFSLSPFTNKYIYFYHHTWNSVKFEVYSDIVSAWVEVSTISTGTPSVSSNGRDNNWTKTYHGYRTVNKTEASSTTQYRISQL